MLDLERQCSLKASPKVFRLRHQMRLSKKVLNLHSSILILHPRHLTCNVKIMSKLPYSSQRPIIKRRSSFGASVINHHASRRVVTKKTSGFAGCLLVFTLHITYIRKKLSPPSESLTLGSHDVGRRSQPLISILHNRRNAFKRGVPTCRLLLWQAPLTDSPYQTTMISELVLNIRNENAFDSLSSSSQKLGCFLYRLCAHKTGPDSDFVDCQTPAGNPANTTLVFKSGQEPATLTPYVFFIRQNEIPKRVALHIYTRDRNRDGKLLSLQQY